MGGKDPLEEGLAACSGFLPGETREPKWTHSPPGLDMTEVQAAQGVLETFWINLTFSTWRLRTSRKNNEMTGRPPVALEHRWVVGDPFRVLEGRRGPWPAVLWSVSTLATSLV